MNIYNHNVNAEKSNKNSKRNIFRTVISSAAIAASALGAAHAGVPLNNLQGTGGIAFNPLAYTACHGNTARPAT